MINRIRSWLYVPGHRPELLAKAMAGKPDAIVFDLEDAVPATAKNAARKNAESALQGDLTKPIWIRVNALKSHWHEADLATVTNTTASGLRLPKVEDPTDVVEIAEQTNMPLHLIIESALGVEKAYSLATAHHLVAVVSLGEADLMADLRIRDRRYLDWARHRVLNANRAAHLPNPPQAVWTDVADVAGLERDTLLGRDQGFFGRTVVHPSQVETVNKVFTPDHSEVEQSRELLNSLAQRSDQSESAWLDENGSFVDPGVAASARWLVDLSETVGESNGPAKTDL